MGTQGGEHVFRCLCYEEHTDYQKILDLKDAGLVIYRQTAQSRVNSRSSTAHSATSASKDTLVIQNTKVEEILSTDVMQNLDLDKISCPRCRHIIENAKRLYNGIPKINRNDIMGICDHCRKKISYSPCQECDEVVKKFVTGSDDTKKDSKRHTIKIWLSKMHRLLKDVMISEKHVMKKGATPSDINLQNVHHNSPISLREPEVGDLLYSGTLRTGSTKSLDLSDRSYHSHPNYPKVKKRTTFAEYYDQEYYGPSKNKKFISQSHQDFTYIVEDESLTFLEKEQNKLEEGLLAREEPGRKDFRSRKSITDSSLKKVSAKYKTEKLFKSESELSKNKPFTAPHDKYKSEDALKSSTDLSSRKLSPENVKAENALLSSLSGFDVDNYEKEGGFSYLFLKEEDDKKKLPKKRISSLELIKNTQDMLQARAEKEEIKREDQRLRKQEEQERKRIAREEKRAQAEQERLLREHEKRMAEEDKRRDEEEAKRLAAEEKKRLAEEEKIRLGEEKAKKLAEKEQKKSAKEEQKKLSGKVKETKEPKEKPDSVRKKQITETESKSREIPQENKKTLTEERKKKYEEKSKFSSSKKPKEKSPEPEIKPPKFEEKPPKPVKEVLEKPEPVPKRKEPKKPKDHPKEKEKKEVPDKSKEDKDKKEKEIKKQDDKEVVKEEAKEPTKPKVDAAPVDDFRKLLAEQAKQKEEIQKQKKQQEEEERKAREAAAKMIKDVKSTPESKPTRKSQLPPESAPKPEKKQEKPTTKDLNIKQIKLMKQSGDDLILQLVKLKQSAQGDAKKTIEKVLDVNSLLKRHKGHNNKDKNCVVCRDSDIELDLESITNKRVDDDKLADMIIGQKIFKYKPPLTEKHKEEQVKPVLFKTCYEEPSIIEKPKGEIVTENPDQIEPIIQKKPPGSAKGNKGVEQEVSKGIIRYALSDRAFIDKGWTLLPTEKVVRKMNVYRMRPAQPEFDWFEHNKNKRLMQYDTGEKLAEFDDNGRGRWYYKNGRLALDYYNAEETNVQQRYVVYSSGEPDERGRSRPITILATFDYLGNGVVFDHSGKIRLKYNQTEGVVLDRSIGPVSHWKWHTLNDPPVLQQVMIDTQMSYKDPDIVKLGGPGDNKARPDNEEMLAIEFDNFIKEKSKKLTQKFKPFQIKMKALKINESFSLKVLDQATVYLIFRDGSANLKLNIGMILDHKEIVDTDTAEVGEVSNNLERLPARTESIAAMQASVAHAARVERQRVERERRLHLRLRPAERCASADRRAAAAPRPLRRPFCRHPASSHTSATATGYPCKCRKPSSSDLYYDTRLI